MEFMNYTSRTAFMLLCSLVLTVPLHAGNSDKQVLIETRIAEVSRTHSNDLGFDFNSSQGVQEIGNGAGIGSDVDTRGVDAASGFTQTLFEGPVDPLFASFGDDANDLLAAPRLTTTTQAESQIEVVPVVDSDNNLQIQLTPQVVDVVDLEGASSLATPPVVETSQLTTHVIVDSGQTVALGGLVAEDVQDTSDKVPFLGDVPLIGRLFKQTADTNAKRNLKIFVTPTIVKDTGE